MLLAAIGDVHGRLDRLERLIPQVARCDLIVSLGDYVDSGPDPIGVLDYLAWVPRSLRLVGNHELKLLKKWARGESALPDFVTEDQMGRLRRAMDRCLGISPQYFYRDDHVLMSHAPAYLWQHDPRKFKKDTLCFGHTAKNIECPEGFRRRKPLTEVYPNETSSKPVIFGHIHSHAFVVGPNTYCVDFEANKPDGRLAALVMEDGEIVDQILVD